MISCPNCKQTLPDWATTCQFCGANVGNVPRPKQAPMAYADDVQKHGGKLPDKTIWGIYYALSALWVINGAAGLFQSLTPRTINGETFGPGIFGMIGAVFSGIVLLIGIGLLLKVEFVRGIVNFVSALQLLFGVLDLIGSLVSILGLGGLGVLFVIIDVFRIAVAGATIWVIGETMRHSPNT